LDTFQHQVEAAELVPLSAESQPWDAFRDEIRIALQGICLPPPDDADLVLFSSLAAGRWLSVDHLLVLGLAEGELPRPPAVDPFYTAMERSEAPAGGSDTATVSAHPLPLVPTNPGEDASLWWQALNGCRKELTLLRPSLDENGVPWLPSPYWVEVLEKTPGAIVEDIPVGALPEPAKCASLPELLVSLAARRYASAPKELSPLWQAVHEAAEVVKSRQSWEKHPVYEGILQNPALKAELSRRFGPAARWSASRLGQIGACPYSFFARCVLQLEALGEPEEGLDALQRGQLLHAVLEKLYRRLTADGVSPSKTGEAAVFEQLDAACEQVFPNAPDRLGFRPGALWRHEQAELRRVLRLLAAWECEQNGETPRFRPFRQELRFPSVKLRSPDGNEIHLSGVIDRVDRDDQGRLRVIDYKSGGTRYTGEHISRGVALQAPLYALVAEILIQGSQAAESLYLSINKQESSGTLRFENGASADETVQEAVSKACYLGRLAAGGIFPAAPETMPSGKLACDSPCDYAALCRAGRHEKTKGSRYLPIDIQQESSEHAADS
jgi:ATP-dependent helicase/DNAse subunit B